MDRYVLRRDAAGWSVFDTARDETAVVNETPLIDMSEEMAREAAGLLCSRAARPGLRGGRAACIPTAVLISGELASPCCPKMLACTRWLEGESIRQ